MIKCALHPIPDAYPLDYPKKKPLTLDILEQLLNNTQDPQVLSAYSRDLAPASALYLSHQKYDLEPIVDWEYYQKFK